MIRDDDLAILKQYILSDRQRTELALQVIAAAPRIKEAILSGFLEELVNYLKRHEQDEKWEIRDNISGNSYGGCSIFSVSLESWLGKLQVAIEPQVKLGNFIFGVKFADGRERKDYNDALLKQLQHLGDGGKQSGWWPVYFKADADWIDWSSEETLFRMHTEPELLQEKIGSRIIALMREGNEAITTAARSLERSGT